MTAKTMRTRNLDSSIIGQTLPGGIVLTASLGEGGMGIAFRGRQADLNRDVCVKFLRPERVSDANDYGRFKREASALSKLSHKHILNCYSFGLMDSVYPYLVVEYIQGTSLRALISEGTLNWRVSAELLMQVCDALEFTHSAGLVHRDIKPENVMVEYDGTTYNTKLIDFGLVGVLENFDATSNDYITLTESGEVIGSVNYMAPESFLRSEPHKSKDIYALGCMFYEMLVGEPPFFSYNAVAIMNKHLKEKLPSLPESVAPREQRLILERILEIATRKNPDERFSSCAEIQELLQEAMSLACSAEPASLSKLKSKKGFRTNKVASSKVVALVALVGCMVAAGILCKELAWGLSALPAILSETAGRKAYLDKLVGERKSDQALFAAHALHLTDDSTLQQICNSAIEKGQFGAASSALIEQAESVQSASKKRPLDVPTKNRIMGLSRQVSISMGSLAAHFAAANNEQSKGLEKLYRILGSIAQDCEQTREFNNLRAVRIAQLDILVCACRYADCQKGLSEIASGNYSIPTFTKDISPTSDSLKQFAGDVLASSRDEYLKGDAEKAKLYLERLRPAFSRIMTQPGRGALPVEILKSLSQTRYIDQCSPSLFVLVQNFKFSRFGEQRDALLQLAQIALNSGRKEESRVVCRQLAKLFEMNQGQVNATLDMIPLGSLLAKTGDFREALRLIQWFEGKIQRRPHDLRVLKAEKSSPGQIDNNMRFTLFKAWVLSSVHENGKASDDGGESVEAFQLLDKVENLPAWHTLISQKRPGNPELFTGFNDLSLMEVATLIHLRAASYYEELDRRTHGNQKRAKASLRRAAEITGAAPDFPKGYEQIVAAAIVLDQPNANGEFREVVMPFMQKVAAYVDRAKDVNPRVKADVEYSMGQLLLSSGRATEAEECFLRYAETLLMNALEPNPAYLERIQQAGFRNLASNFETTRIACQATKLSETGKIQEARNSISKFDNQIEEFLKDDTSCRRVALNSKSFGALELAVTKALLLTYDYWNLRKKYLTTEEICRLLPDQKAVEGFRLLDAVEKTESWKRFIAQQGPGKAGPARTIYHSLITKAVLVRIREAHYYGYLAAKTPETQSRLKAALLDAIRLTEPNPVALGGGFCPGATGHLISTHGAPKELAETVMPLAKKYLAYACSPECVNPYERLDAEFALARLLSIRGRKAEAQEHFRTYVELLTKIPEEQRLPINQSIMTEWSDEIKAVGLTDLAIKYEQAVAGKVVQQ